MDQSDNFSLGRRSTQPRSHGDGSAVLSTSYPELPTGDLMIWACKGNEESIQQGQIDDDHEPARIALEITPSMWSSEVCDAAGRGKYMSLILLWILADKESVLADETAEAMNDE